MELLLSIIAILVQIPETNGYDLIPDSFSSEVLILVVTLQIWIVKKIFEHDKRLTINEALDERRDKELNKKK